MTRKMYKNLLETYKISVFQISKTCKVFNNFDLISRIREKNTLGCATVEK